MKKKLITQKKAQETLDYWCQVWGVPSIPVYVKKIVDWGYFDDTPFRIYIHPKAKMSYLHHEFVHYLLCMRTPEVEEEICDRLPITRTK